MTITDVLAMLCIAAIGMNGATGGFTHALIGPASIILSLPVGWYALHITHNFLASMLIGGLAPFFINGILSFLAMKYIHHNEKPRPSFLSRLGGLLINLTWGTALAGLIIALLSFMPLASLGFKGAAIDIVSSQAYQMIEPLPIFQRIDAKSKPYLSSLSSTNKDQKPSLAQDPVTEDLMNDPRIQKLLSDPEIKDAMDHRDFAKLLQSPAMLELQKDPLFLIKVMRASGAMREKGTNEALP